MVWDIHVLVCREECKDRACQYGVSERGVCFGRLGSRREREENVHSRIARMTCPFFRREMEVWGPFGANWCLKVGALKVYLEDA